MGDVISKVGLGLFGQGYRALDPNRKREVFRSSFHWKLSWNLSLLPLDAIRIDEQHKNEYNSRSASLILIKLVSIRMFSMLGFLNMQFKFTKNQYFHFYPHAFLAQFGIDAEVFF